MADQVQTRIEEMLPELVDLEEHKILTAAEIKKIMKSRKEFEMDVTSQNANLLHFRKYIKHELAVESLKRLRQEKLGVKRLGVSKFSIIRRVHYLYSRAVMKFSTNKDLWLEHVKFCADTGSVTSMNKVIMRALRYHPREAAFWVLAAERQSKLGNIDSARKMLLRGLRAKPLNQLSLWNSLIQLEIKVAEKIADNVKLVEMVYEQACADLADTEAVAQMTVQVYSQLKQMAGFDVVVDRCRAKLIELRGDKFVSAMEDQELGFVEDVNPVITN